MHLDAFFWIEIGQYYRVLLDITVPIVYIHSLRLPIGLDLQLQGLSGLVVIEMDVDVLDLQGKCLSGC